MPGDCSAGEEDDRHHENNAGDDHHPRRGLVEPRMRCSVRGRRRAGGWRLDQGFGCLGHFLIMPTRTPAIKHRAHRVAGDRPAQPDALPPAAQSGRVPTVLAAQEPGETQNDHGDEHDSRDDRHPGRYLIKPLGMFAAPARWAAARRETAGSTAEVSRSCFFIMPQVSSGRDRTAGREVSVHPASAKPPASPASLGARRPAAGTPGCIGSDGLRERRSQRRGDRLRRL